MLVLMKSRLFMLMFISVLFSFKTYYSIDLDEIVEMIGSNEFVHGRLCWLYILLVGATASLDDLLIVCAIYPAIAKKSAYPCPASLSKKYISFMKYVKKM